MSIILQSSSGGSITLSEPATASNFTQTLPSASGTVMVSGNMPAFSAIKSSSQSLNNAVTTKIVFQSEEFDTNNNYDTANSRFTPTVAGYYQISATLNIEGVTGNNFLVMIYKNGSEFKRGNQSANNTANNTGVVSSALVYLNGSTDYLEIYGFQGSGVTVNVSSNSAFTYFQGVLVRAA